MPGDQVSTVDFLRSISRPDTGERVVIGEMVEGAGARVYGLALLIFALPEALPIPAAGVTAVVAIPLFAIAGYMTVAGAQRRLPGWVRRRSIKRSVIEWAIDKAAPVLRRADRVSRPRWHRLAAADRWLGLVCLVLTVVLALPIPFGNVLPAICIVAIGFGMLRQDGMIIAGALAASALTVAGMTTAIIVTGRLVLDWDALPW